MATIGPIVRNEAFFFVVILGFAALVVLREWLSAKEPAADKAVNPAGAAPARIRIPPPAPMELCGGSTVHGGRLLVRR